MFKRTKPVAKKNVILSSFIDKMPQISEGLENLESTCNFQQVAAMARLGEISKLVILVCAYNYSKSPENTCSGQKAAEEIHKINPSIPILVWKGHEHTDGPAIDKENETYLECDASELIPMLRDYVAA